MPVITKIEVQKKNQDRVNIYVDENFFILLKKKILDKF